MANSTELFHGTDGYKPLPLPAKGEDLLSGRQYYLDPVARCTVEDVYGYRGVPAIIECLYAFRRATRVVTITYDESDVEVKRSTQSHDGQAATFRAFLAYQRVLKFTIDLAKVAELKPFYEKSPNLPKYMQSDENPRKGERAARLVEKLDLSILD